MRTTPEMRQEFVSLYQRGKSVAEIAREFGVAPKTVRYWLERKLRDGGPVVLDTVPQWTLAGWALFRSPIEPPKTGCRGCKYLAFCKAVVVQGRYVLPCEGVLAWEVIGHDEEGPDGRKKWRRARG